MICFTRKQYEDCMREEENSLSSGEWGLQLREDQEG